MTEFKNVPFPHVLKGHGAYTQHVSSTGIHFVTDQDIKEGEYLIEHSHMIIEDGQSVAVKKAWLIRKINEKRKAKGVWADRPRPFFYDADASYQGLKKAYEL